MPSTQDFDLNLQGLEEVKMMLKSLPDSVNKKVQSDLAKKGGQIVAKQLRQDSPDGNNNKKAKQKIGENIVVKDNGNGGAIIGFTKRVFYALFLSGGTKKREVGKKKGGKYKSGNRGAISASNFVDKSHETAAPLVIDFMSSNYLKIIAQSIKRQLKKVTSNL